MSERASLAWLLVLVLMLSGCGDDPLPTQMQPTLACTVRVICHALAWRVGVWRGPNISGLHIRCTCDVPDTQTGGGTP